MKKININLIEAARKGDIKKLRNLLDGGADVNAALKDGYTALMMAANSDFSDIQTVKFLVEKGADTSIKNKSGDTAEMIAKHYDHPEIAKYLKGEDINKIPTGISIRIEQKEKIAPSKSF